MAEKNSSIQAVDNAYNRALAQYSHRQDVTGVDIGYKYVNGKPTDTMSIRIHIEEKKPKSALEPMDMIPEAIESIPVDIIQGRYLPLQQEFSQKEAVRRTNHRPVMQPGVSVAHKNSSAGTLGMFVKDKRTGKPAILSNWHVLAGERARPGDAIVQPGPYDGGRDPRDTVARLERMYLGRDGDAAIAILNDSAKFEPNIADMDIIIDKIQYPELGDIVSKSGRTTRVTRGRVMGKGRYFITYHKRVGINGFVIAPLDPDNPRNEEISRGGDSGSVWLKEGTTAAVGLHFAGETDTRPSAEHALACFTNRIFAKLQIEPWLPAKTVKPTETETDLSLLWKQLGSASATRIFETMNAREIRSWSNRLMKGFPQSQDSTEALEQLINSEWNMEIGPFGSAAIGFAAGATAQIAKKQLDSGKHISPEEFANLMASFLAGAVNGGRFIGNNH